MNIDKAETSVFLLGNGVDISVELPPGIYDGFVIPAFWDPLITDTPKYAIATLSQPSNDPALVPDVTVISPTVGYQTSFYGVVLNQERLEFMVPNYRKYTLKVSASGLSTSQDQRYFVILTRKGECDEKRCG